MRRTVAALAVLSACTTTCGERTVERGDESATDEPIVREGALELREAYEAGKVALTFTGRDEGANVDLTVENTTTTDLTIVIEADTTMFDLATGRAGVVAQEARTLDVPAGGRETITLPQTGEGRLVSGSITLTAGADRE